MFLTGAGTETPGNGAPSHRVRLKTGLGVFISMLCQQLTPATEAAHWILFF
jgi:hypothetical protein